MKLAWVILFLSALAWAAPTDRYLYEYARKKFRKAGNELYPNRVYSLYEPDKGIWVLAVTDERGKFPEPREALIPGSVLAGNLIGADASQRFELGEKGEWTPVNAKEWHWYWVKGGVPLYKFVYESSSIKEKPAKRE